MALLLDLPPEMELQITEEAARKNLPLSDYLAAIIRERHTLLSEGASSYVLSESALAKDWLKPEEDAAWQHL